MNNNKINIIYMSYRYYMHIYEVCFIQNQTSVFLMETDWSWGQSGINSASENLRPLPGRVTLSWLSWVVQYFPELSKPWVTTHYKQWKHKATSHTQTCMHNELTHIHKVHYELPSLKNYNITLVYVSYGEESFR